MLYELVALKHAFEGQSLMGVMYKIVEGGLPDWPEQYSKDLLQVFERYHFVPLSAYRLKIKPVFVVPSIIC